MLVALGVSPFGGYAGMELFHMSQGLLAQGFEVCLSRNVQFRAVGVGLPPCRGKVDDAYV